MPNVSTLTVRLSANSAKLVAEFSKAQRRAKTFGEKVKQSVNVAGAAFLRAGVAAATGLGAMALAGIRSADQIGKLVDRLGSTTEAFSELKFVAERSGIAFNTLTMGLQRMQRRLAEAAVGTGEAQGALKELGIDAQAIAKLPLDKQFETIAEALSRVAVSGDKTRLAMKLFDSEGVALLQTMKNGAEGIRSLREEAQRLGVSLSRDQVDAAVRAADAMTNLKASANALSITLTNALAPSIAEVVDGWNNILTGNRQAEIARRMDILRKDLEFYGHDPKMVEQITAEFATLARELERLENPSREAVLALEEVSEIVVTAAKRTGTYEDNLKKLSEQFQTAEMRANKLRAALAHYGEDLDPDQIKLIQDSIKEILTGGIEEINTGPILRMKKVTKAATDEMSEYAKQAARNMQDAFADFLFDPFADGVRGMLKGFEEAIRRMIANQASARLFDFLGSQGGFLGSFFGGTRAIGGPVVAGVPYLVGEKGPELMVPNQSGAIIPNDKLGQSGGVTNNYYFQAGADVATIKSEIIPLIAAGSERAVATVHDQKRRGLL